MFKRVKQRAEALMANADGRVDQVGAILESIDEALKEGITFQLQVFHKKIPIKLILEKDENDERTVERTDKDCEGSGPSTV
jgi:hypothetical protein